MSGGSNNARQVGVPPDNADERAIRARKEAARWFSLLSSGRATASDAEALKQWCQVDPLNAQAYAAAARVWDMLGPVAADAEARPIADPALRPPGYEPRLARRAFLGGALAASVGAAGYLAIRPPLGLWPSLAELRADVRTNIGERRKVSIANGVDIELNTQSSFSIERGPSGARRIVLVSGEALVSTDLESQGACAISAGAGEVFARNAKVDIRYENPNVRVVCVNGNVEVRHGGRSINVASAEQLVYGPQGTSEIGAADSEAVTAWQKGLLIFRQTSLESVIDDVNRYRGGNIILLNRGLSQRLVDARFRLDHLENVIIYLRQAFNAHIVELPAGVVLVS